MLLLQANDIIQEFAERRVLDIDSFSVYDGDRIGLVGENGAGKSTFMTILAGARKPDSGRVTLDCPMALVPQFGSGEEFITSGGEGWTDDAAASGEMASRFHSQELRSGLSGGECTRRRISGALARNPRLLMLDEPTTDLDSQGIAELTHQLENFPGALLLISHDRALLDTLCNSIAELEDGHITMYPGNYSAYAAEKERRRDYQQFEFDQYRSEKARLTLAIMEKEGHAHSVTKLPKRMGNSEARLHRRSATEIEEKLHRTASALRTRLDHLEEKERPRDTPAITMQLGAAGGIISKRALEIRRLKLEVPGRVLVKDVSLALPTGSHTALIGPNGCGKTTLVSRIMDGAQGVKLSPGVKIGYFSQLSERTLDMDATALENAMRDSTLPQSMARIVLNNLRLDEDDVFKRVRVLSGGERVKVALARLLLSDANMLILDEPTNHLDIFALEALENLLSGYAGTLLLVSHDRRFLSSVAQRLVIFDNGRVNTFEGTLAAYDEKKAAAARKVDRSEEQKELERGTIRMNMAMLDAKLNGKGLTGDEREQLVKQYFELAARLRALA